MSTETEEQTKQQDVLHEVGHAICFDCNDISPIEMFVGVFKTELLTLCGIMVPVGHGEGLPKCPMCAELFALVHPHTGKV